MAVARKTPQSMRRRQCAGTLRLTCLGQVAVSLAYSGYVQAQTYITPSGTYGPGSYTDAFQFFGTNGTIQGSTISTQPPYPFGAGGAGVSVASGGSATINPDLGPNPAISSSNRTTGWGRQTLPCMWQMGLSPWSEALIRRGSHTRWVTESRCMAFTSQGRQVRPSSWGRGCIYPPTGRTPMRFAAMACMRTPP